MLPYRYQFTLCWTRYINVGNFHKCSNKIVLKARKHFHSVTEQSLRQRYRLVPTPPRQNRTNKPIKKKKHMYRQSNKPNFTNWNKHKKEIRRPFNGPNEIEGSWVSHAIKEIVEVDGLNRGWGWRVHWKSERSSGQEELVE